MMSNRGLRSGKAYRRRLGVAKAFTMGAILGQSNEQTVDYFEHEALGKTVFRTPAGKQLAEEGRAYALEFLKRLRRELTYRDGG